MLKPYLVTVYAKIRKLTTRVFKFKFIDTHNKLIQLHYKITTQTVAPKINYSTTISNKFRTWSDRVEEEYVYELNTKSLKDKYHGWLITDSNKIINQSIPRNPNPIYGSHPIPNRFDYIFKKHKQEKHRSVISCDSIHHFGPNYFHFFFSFIGQLALLEEHGVPLQMPILIPKYMLQVRYFNDLQELVPKIRKLKFVNYEDKLHSSEKVYFAKTNPYSIETITRIRCFLNLDELLETIKNRTNLNTKEYERIFLNRKSSGLRYLKNGAAIENLVKDYGFKVVFAEDYTLAEQIQIFSNAKFIISIHGAGLANLLWRIPNPVNLFEIFSQDLIYAGFATLILQNGGSYEAILGGEEVSNGFFVNLEEFKIALEKWLQIN